MGRRIRTNRRTRRRRSKTRTRSSPSLRRRSRPYSRKKRRSTQRRRLVGGADKATLVAARGTAKTRAAAAARGTAETRAAAETAAEARQINTEVLTQEARRRATAKARASVNGIKGSKLGGPNRRGPAPSPPVPDVDIVPGDHQPPSILLARLFFFFAGGCF